METDSSSRTGWRTLRAFKRANVKNPLVRVRDGEEALDYLFGRGAYTGRDVRDLPAVTLLDINMPKISGLDVLKAIRADERSKHLPVVILTSSNQDKDRLNAYTHLRNPISTASTNISLRKWGTFLLGEVKQKFKAP